MTSNRARTARGPHALSAILTALAVLAAMAVAFSSSASAATSSTLLSGDGSTPNSIGGGAGVDDGPVSGQGKGDSNARPRGAVTFGVRPAGPKIVDQRTTWTYSKLSPGQVVVDHVGFVNASNQSATFTAYAADGTNTATGGFSVVPSNRSSVDLGTWVALGRAQVTVPARSTVVMPFTLTVPKNAEPGDHAGGIIASFRTYAKDTKGNIVAVDSRVGARVYVRVSGALHPRLKIERMETSFDPGGVFGSASAVVTFTVRNEGNVRLQGRQSVRVSDLFGAAVLGENVPDLPELLPKSSFTFSVHTHGLMPVSYFTADVTVDPQSVTGNVDPALEQAFAQRRFVGLSLSTVAVLAALILAAGYVFWRRRRAKRPLRKPPAPKSSSPSGSDPGAPSEILLGGDQRKAYSPVTAPSGGNPSRALAPEADRPDIVARGAHRVQRPRAVALAGWLGAAAVFAGASTALPAQALVARSSSGPAVTAAQGPGGSITFVPGKGADIDPMYAVLSGPCPAPATHTVGVLTGPGFPAEGINVVPSSQAGMRHDESFGVPLQNTMKNFAAMSGVKLQGDYTLTVRCVDRLAQHLYATFTGVITFKDPAHFTAPVPKTPPNYGVPVGALTLVFPQLAGAAGQTPGSEPPAAGQATPAQSAAPAASAGADGGAVQAGASQVPAVTTTDGSSSGTGGGSGGSAVMAVISLLALAGAAGLFIASRRGRRTPTLAATAVTARWPDEEAPDRIPS